MEEYETVLRMIRQARLAVGPEEEDLLARQVVGLLVNFKVLASLEVGEAPGRLAVGPGRLRADDPGPTLERSAALANAPDGSDEYIAVQKVLPEADDG